MLAPREAKRPHAPGYGLLDASDGEGVLDWPWADERLRGNRTWWLSTTRADGRPHVMPIWAVWLGDGIALSTGHESAKYRNLSRDARCTIIPERGDESVIVEGVAEPLPADRRAEFIAAYLDVYSFDPSVMNEPEFLIRPVTVFGFIDADERFVKTATRWRF